jgi:hypothetical protein
MRCNKESCELSDHAGPFKLQGRYDNGLEAHQCQACGNTVIKVALSGEVRSGVNTPWNVLQSVIKHRIAGAEVNKQTGSGGTALQHRLHPPLMHLAPSQFPRSGALCFGIGKTVLCQSHPGC